jgi:Tol biopolymer transport system component
LFISKVMYKMNTSIQNPRIIYLILITFAVALVLTITQGCSINSGYKATDTDTPPNKEFPFATGTSNLIKTLTPVSLPLPSPTPQMITSTPIVITPSNTAIFNPKGSIVVARNSEFDRGIYKYELETGIMENLTPIQAGSEFFWGPSWSPDGTQLVYSFGLQDTALFLFDFDMRSPHKIKIQTDCNINSEPDWSPDGQAIVFRVCYDLFLYIIHDQNVMRLTQTVDPDFAENPTWSPDGEQIAFLGSNGQINDNYRIFIMDKDGQNRKSVAPDVSVGSSKISWSPDGQYIAFRSREGCGDICTIRVDDGSKTCLTQTPSGEKDPTWSPDSNFIAYVATDEQELCNQEHGEPIMLDWQLHILQVSSGQDKQVTDIMKASFNSPDWLPSQ